MQDLQTALKVAKDYDKILLKNGNYEIKGGNAFEVKKCIEIVGSGSDTIIKGPWVLKGTIHKPRCQRRAEKWLKSG